MQPRNLQQTLTRVISEMLARNRSYFGAGGPGYYGLEVNNVSLDGSEFDLNLIFRSGHSYCCVEHGCHIPLHGCSERNARWFKQVRDGLKLAGIETLPAMKIRKLRVIVEEGAITQLPHQARAHEPKMEYDTGPFNETR